MAVGSAGRYSRCSPPTGMRSDCFCMNANKPHALSTLDTLTVRTLYAILNGATTTRDICTVTGIRSTSTVLERMNRLRAAGLISWTPRTHATLQVLYAEP